MGNNDVSHSVCRGASLGGRNIRNAFSFAGQDMQDTEQDVNNASTSPAESIVSGGNATDMGGLALTGEDREDGRNR